MIERSLLAAQRAEGLDLGLVGKVGDDAPVGLEAAQDVGAHEVAQRRIRAHRPVGQALDEVRELPGRAEQTGIDEVEDRPQVAEPVLDRRAGQGDARAGLERLDGAGLLGRRVLDRLGLVEDDEPPRRGGEPGHARQRAVAGDDEVGVTDMAGVGRLQLLGWHLRGMGDDRLQARCKACDLGRPVGEQRCRRHQQAGLGPGFDIARSLVLQHQQQRQHLDGLAEPHVVGKACAEAKSRQQIEPLHARLLIGPQRRPQRLSGVHAS